VGRRGDLGGPITDAALAAALVDGLRLATVLACIGAANALANPKRLLASVPAALYEVGVAVVVALSFAPSMVASVQRIRAARRLRGRPDRGLRSIVSVAMPVLEDALERSLALAAAMDSRGYGRRASVPARTRRLTTTLTLVGLGAIVGRALRAARRHRTGAARSASTAGGDRGGGNGAPDRRCRCHPDPLPAGSVGRTGVADRLRRAAAAIGTIVTSLQAPATLDPAAWPLLAVPLPPAATVGILLASLPAWLTPFPPPGERVYSPRPGRSSALAPVHRRRRDHLAVFLGGGRMIELDRVGVTYHGATAPCLWGVDLHIEEGELCLVVGRTGSGKSTLLRTLNGLVPHFTGGTLHGRVTVAGRDTATHPPRELADLVGVVGPGSQIRLRHRRGRGRAGLRHGVPRAGTGRHAPPGRGDPGPARPRRAAAARAGHPVRRGASAGRDRLGADRPPGRAGAGRADLRAGPTGRRGGAATLHRLVHDLGLTVVLAEHRLERVVPFADRIVHLPGDGAAIEVGTPAQIMATSPIAPPIVELGRLAGWSPCR
jgi:ABC-type multidrug transport system fused ATPase/permease subunit